jgi:hypothetical protein
MCMYVCVYTYIVYTCMSIYILQPEEAAQCIFVSYSYAYVCVYIHNAYMYTRIYILQPEEAAQGIFTTYLYCKTNINMYVCV